MAATATSRTECMATALGRGVKFFLFDQNAVLRRVKRGILAAALPPPKHHAHDEAQDHVWAALPGRETG